MYRQSYIYLLSLVALVALTGCPKKVIKKPVVRTKVVTPFEFLLKCKASLDAGKHGEVKQFCNKALEGNQHKAHMYLAESAEQQNDFKAAASHFKQYIEKTKSADSKLQLRLANSYIKSGQTKPALEMFEAFRKSDPNNIGLMNNMVMLYRKDKQFKRSEALAQAILARDAKNVQAYRNLMLLYYDWGKYNQAELVASLALGAIKKDAGIYNNLGMVYLKKKEYTKASANFLLAIKQNPKNIQANLNLGTLALKRGAWKQAYTHFGAVVKHNPTHDYANRNYATALMGMQKMLDAKGIYEGILQRKPNDAEATYQIGVIYFVYKKLKKQKDSKQWFDRFLANPDAKKLPNYKVAKTFIKQAKQRLKILEAMSGSTPKPAPKKKKKPKKNISLDDIPGGKKDGADGAADGKTDGKADGKTDGKATNGKTDAKTDGKTTTTPAKDTKKPAARTAQPASRKPAPAARKK